MTQEDKNLLLKDLCGRLPYEVKLKIGDYSDYKLIGIVISDENPIKIEVVEKDVAYKIEVIPDLVEPYLRPMESMTEDEMVEFKWLNDECEMMPTFEYVPVEHYRLFDWLNRYHFDFRNLIEKGLAIAVNESNNPYKE